MVDFVAHKYDVLLATTIIENGLDIPNANTIVINRADRYGLSQLYQLRGRVGRSDRRAYAYLLIPPEDALSPVAKKRLAAIREFSDLGSGFRVAALDLEIRGAGNLLGGEQSGHIEAVGFDMYMKLLEQTIKELKGEEIEDDVRATVNLRVDLRIDESYIPDMNQRLTVYRRMAAVRSEAELDRVLEEVRDRYGPPPASIQNLAEYARIRLLADRVGIESIDREGQIVVLKFRPEAKLDPAWLFRVIQERNDIQLTPPATLKLDLRKGSERPGDEPAGRQGALPKASWWTARATAGEVAPGFSRGRDPSPADGRSTREGGVFSRVAGLLRDLSEGGRLKYSTKKLESNHEKSPDAGGSLRGIDCRRANHRHAVGLADHRRRRRAICDAGAWAESHRAGSREGERRHHHQDRARKAAGRRPAVSACNGQVDPETLKNDETLKKTLAEITPQCSSTPSTSCCSCSAARSSGCTSATTSSSRSSPTSARSRASRTKRSSRPLFVRRA